jgi:hypothetical protein
MLFLVMWNGWEINTLQWRGEYKERMKEGG